MRTILDGFSGEDFKFHLVSSFSRAPSVCVWGSSVCGGPVCGGSSVCGGPVCVGVQ